MWLINFAMRRPMTILTVLIGIALMAVLTLTRMPIDIFPNLNLPVIYVAQPYGGLDPAQMEGYIASYYEYHFLYILGIEHVESQSIQNVSLLKLYFHPGADMSQALAQTVSYVERARAFMPPGTVPPFIMRFDAGSVPVGYLVFSSETRGLGEIQDLALFRVRPMFSSLPGVSAPPPFGGNQRTIVIRVDPVRLRSYQMSPNEVIQALSNGNVITPAGNVGIGDSNRLAPINSVVENIKELENIPIRTGPGSTVYMRDIGTVENGTDLLTGYALVNGKRAVYIPVTKRADASTIDVVNTVKRELPDMQSLVPADIKIGYEFDQSIVVKNATKGLGIEGALGAILTGIMVLLFLRDRRSALIVITSIPFALLSALVSLWLSGQTLNIMTLGGLALSIGVLVDEATVAIENIHVQLTHHETLARAVLHACQETVTPRLLAMLSVLAVFVPSFFMVGISRALFVPLSLAVGFAMLASYFLSNTLLPVMSVWLLRSHTGEIHEPAFLQILHRFYRQLMNKIMKIRNRAIAGYVAIVAIGLFLVYPFIGTDIFPTVDTGQFQVRLRAPTGSKVERTEQIALKALEEIQKEAGKKNVEITIGFVGTQPSSYPVNTIHLWTSGPHEAVLQVALRAGSGIGIEEFKERLREKLPLIIPGTTLSFEAGDIVSKIMNFGAPTPIEVAVSSSNMTDNVRFAQKIKKEMEQLKMLRDVQFDQPMDYPTVNIKVNRDRAGQLGVNMKQLGQSLVAATSSSRFVQPNYWRDPSTGVAYQVQVEVPQARIGSIEDLLSVPAMPGGGAARPLVGDVAQINYGTAPGEYHRYNMRRMVTITANAPGYDLGSIAKKVQSAIRRAGEPARGMRIDIRGQVPPMIQTLSGLKLGLGIAIIVIFLLLSAYFQSMRMALIIMVTVPAIITGVVGALMLTGTTVNVQSFMGAIMAIGIGVANAILLITFAENNRRQGMDSFEAALEAGRSRLRPILMTTCAMIAGMLPVAFAFGGGSSQTAPLGRAVIGGLAASTVTVLTILPLIFGIVQRRAVRSSPSIHPDDTEMITKQ